MAQQISHVSIRITRPPSQVYAYASDPAHLPEWAAGLSGSIEHTGGQWVAQSPMGPIVVEFVPSNEFGVADHYVTTESGQRFYNPMRVIPDGDECDVVFTVRQSAEMTDEQFGRDTEAVTTDLATLKRLLEAS
jgi:hypothetical protein